MIYRDCEGRSYIDREVATLATIAIIGILFTVCLFRLASCQERQYEAQLNAATQQKGGE